MELLPSSLEDFRLRSESRIMVVRITKEKITRNGVSVLPVLLGLEIMGVHLPACHTDRHSNDLEPSPSFQASFPGIVSAFHGPDFLRAHSGPQNGSLP